MQQTGMIEPDSVVALRKVGLRATKSRIAVYEALGKGVHASAEEILAKVQPHLDHPSLQSVYNALNDFTQAQLVRRIEPAGRPQLFEIRVGDNHHHLVCANCGAVKDVECVIGAAPCLTPSDSHGFSISQAEVTFWGLCPDCQSTVSSDRL